LARDPLLLAAGQLRGAVAKPLPKAHAVKCQGGQPSPLARCDAARRTMYGSSRSTPETGNRR